MVDHPFRTAATTTSGVYDDVLLEAGVKRTIIVLAVDEDLGDFEFDTGDIPLAVSWAATGYVYFYDSTDATTPDDGLTTLVTGNGLRYAIEDAAAISVNSHLGAVTVPTGSEVVGDVYRVAAAATGAFVGQDDNIAVLTRRGWVFATPEIGMTMLNEDTGHNEQFTATGWGGFSVEFDDGSIPPVALQFPAGIVVEDTLNTPPGSPTTGKFWIVGSVPTGAFVGHEADLAYWTGTAWAFMDPADGWAVYHKANGFEVFYTSGSWLGGAGSDLQTFSTAGGATWAKPARGTMALIQAWGAGGSGGRAGTGDGGAGGAGGAYCERLVPLASLSATESVTVGAGGAARTVDNTDGQAGGNSSFGSWLTAYGGGGGCGNTGTHGGGGGGGGQGGAGSTSTGTTGGNGGIDLSGLAGGAGGASTVDGGNSYVGGGGGGGGTNTGNAGNGGSSYYGGGGGGGGSEAGAGSTTGAGGKSVYGGAGGGGSDDDTSRPGGTSVYGGNGGAGASGGNATAGDQPGGGGGGSRIGNSGKGGDGRVRVTVF